MHEIRFDPAKHGLVVEGYSVRFGTIPGPDDPKQRRRVLQLVLHGRGWVIGATPIQVFAGPNYLLPIGLERDGGDLVCLLDPIPPEGSELVVQQWTRAVCPEPFSRRRLPKGVVARAPRRPSR